MKKYFIVSFIFFVYSLSFAQIENIPLSYPIYDFFKEMSVKKIINFDDDNPNLGRFDAAKFLKQIDSKKSELSHTEIELLNKYKVEFIPEEANTDNQWQMFGSGKNFTNNLKDFFSNKQKYIFTVGQPGNNVVIEGIGNIFLGKEIKPNNQNNSLLMDGGFGARGTLFNHLAYGFTFSKGAIFGQNELAKVVYPELRADFKFNENKEALKNYDFTTAYLKYYVEPLDDFGLSFQLGREKLTYGYGYSSKPILSGDNPPLDFFKMNINYKIFRFSSIFASTVGYFNLNRDDRYTKYYSAHRMKVSIPDVIDMAISDIVVYNGRIDFAYFNPILLWHFAEKSLQDRDNKNFVFDFQTKFIKNVEFQATLFMDDDEAFRFLTGKMNKGEKFVYQIGSMLYEPLGLKNLSFTIEYTKIRPYTYSHYDIKNDYSAYGINIGHNLGPNADEIFTRLTYNLSDWGRLNIEYRHRRKGNNIYDAEGNLIKNVGGDIAIAYRDDIDDFEANFLDGERVNSDIIGINFRLIPIRNYMFDFFYGYNIDHNITKNFKRDFSYAFVRLNIIY